LIGGGVGVITDGVGVVTGGLTVGSDLAGVGVVVAFGVDFLSSQPIAASDATTSNANSFFTGYLFGECGPGWIPPRTPAFGSRHASRDTKPLALFPRFLRFFPAGRDF